MSDYRSIDRHPPVHPKPSRLWSATLAWLVLYALLIGYAWSQATAGEIRFVETCQRGSEPIDDLELTRWILLDDGNAIHAQDYAASSPAGCETREEPFDRPDLPLGRYQVRGRSIATAEPTTSADAIGWLVIEAPPPPPPTLRFSSLAARTPAGDEIPLQDGSEVELGSFTALCFASEGEPALASAYLRVGPAEAPVWEAHFNLGQGPDCGAGSLGIPALAFVGAPTGSLELFGRPSLCPRGEDCLSGAELALSIVLTDPAPPVEPPDPPQLLQITAVRQDGTQLIERDVTSVTVEPQEGP